VTVNPVRRLVRRRGRSNRQRAADGSMTLVEHLFELRSRLFKACLALVAGMVVALFFARDIIDFLSAPYFDALEKNGQDRTKLLALAPTTNLFVQLKVALYAGILLSSPVWLYQLWSFITPGLHRHEKRWAYSFVTAAVPLFAGGAALAYVVVAKGLEFLLPDTGTDVAAQLEITAYINFVTSMMLLFGAGFEFPLVVVMLNFAGLVSAQKLLSWWRVAVFLMFAFAAFVTPTPDPFGMIALALPMCALYFVAVGVAFLNDRRRYRGSLSEQYAALGDDETSQLDTRLEPVEGPSPLDDDLDPSALDAAALDARPLTPRSREADPHDGVR